MNDVGEGQPSTASTPLVAAIVLNWNGWRETIQCLRHLLSLERPSCLVIVVDNASTDGSEQRIRDAFPALVVLQAGHNNGYAAGNNVGIRYALERHALYVLILNNDAYLLDASLQRMVDILGQDASLGAVGPTLMASDHINASLAGTLMNTRTGKPIRLTKPPPLEGDCQYIDAPYIPGACMLVRADVIGAVGLLPEQYFLYYEDCDWCLAIRRKGWKLGYVPEARVVHLEHTSTKKDRTTTPYYFPRNFWLFLARNPDATTSIPRARRLHLLESVLMVGSYLRRLQPRQASAVVKGTMDGVFGRYGKRRTTFWR